MTSVTRRRSIVRCPAGYAALLAAGFAVCAPTRADIITTWADTTTAIATDGPNTVHTMALAQQAVYEAVNGITRRYPRDLIDLGTSEGASIESAVAAASRTVLLHEAPTLRSDIEAAYQQAIAAISDGDARTRGIHVGELAAADVLTKHEHDIGTLEPYRPLTSPGVFVPTTLPLGVSIAQQRPWVMKSQNQFRPAPPPSLKSKEWAQDYNETRQLGALQSQARTPAQQEIALFWATALPDIHIGVVRSYAATGSRDITRNARLYAAIMAAVNDAEIAVFEAKYHYQLWRPITAIRNGDRDDNPATERDANWSPLITTPLQPEYPCGHCIIASTIATVLILDAGDQAMPVLSTTSNTRQGVTRYWAKPQDLVDEVINARIYSGVHFRSAGNAGARMGEQIGRLVATAYGLL